MANNDYVNELRAKMFARSGVLIVRDEDEGRVLSKTRAAAVADGYNVAAWKVSTGLRLVADKSGASVDEEITIDTPRGPAPVQDPSALMNALAEWNRGPSVIVAYDFAAIMNRLPTAVMIARQLRDLAERQQSEETADATIQLVICDFEEPQIPCGLQRITLELPDRDECGSLLDDIVEGCSPAVADAAAQDRDRILNALAGLPAYQIENALAESIARTGGIDVEQVRDYKRAMVADKGLTWIDPDPRGFAAVGGLDPLKAWCESRAEAFTPEAAEYGIEAPSGMIVAGLPGCAKSALVKALVERWGFTGLRFDVGATRGKYQGESEASFEAVLKTAEAVAPCILHIDEAEKAFAGVTSGGDADGGTGSRTFSTFLTWMQEREAPVFVYMTANRPESLPSELTRAGRLDGSWWVDAPTRTERAAIVDVYTEKFPRAAAVDRDAIADASRGNSGAEIEAAFKEALIVAFQARRNVETRDIEAQLERLPRVADTFQLSEELQAWRDSAMSANTEEPTETATTNTEPRRRVLRRANQ